MKKVFINKIDKAFRDLTASDKKYNDYLEIAEDKRNFCFDEWGEVIGCKKRELKQIDSKLAQLKKDTNKKNDRVDAVYLDYFNKSGNANAKDWDRLLCSINVCYEDLELDFLTMFSNLRYQHDLELPKQPEREPEQQQQIDFIEEDQPKKEAVNWGGLRDGAGRKAKSGKTSTMRVPDQYKEFLQNIIKFLDDNRDSNQAHKEIYIRSLTDKKQFITVNINSKT